MHTELASLSHCAVPFLSRAAVNFAGTTLVIIVYFYFEYINMSLNSKYNLNY